MSINLERNVQILSEHYVNRFKHLIDTNRKQDAYSTTAHNQTIYRAHIRQLKENSKPTKLTPQNNRK